MDKLTNITTEALNRYFHTLSVLGYKNYKSVYKLLFLIFVEELLNNDIYAFITEGDYRIIVNAVYCILGKDCLFDMPSYETFDSLIHKSDNKKKYRISEDYILRISTGETLNPRVSETL